MSDISPANKLPVVIKETGIYIMRNGDRAIINEIKPNEHKSLMCFTCKGSIEKMFRGKMSFRGFETWHESGLKAGLPTEFDIVRKADD